MEKRLTRSGETWKIETDCRDETLNRFQESHQVALEIGVLDDPRMGLFGICTRRWIHLMIPAFAG